MTSLIEVDVTTGDSATTIATNLASALDAKSDLGAVYYSTGEIEKASLIFKDVYDKDPKDLINSYNLSKTYVAQERFSDAYDVILSVLKMRDCDDYNYFFAGELAFLMGKNYLSHFRKYIELRKTKVKDQHNDFFIAVSEKYLEFQKITDKDKLEFLNYILIQFYENNYDYDSIIMANTILKLKHEKNPLIILAAVFDNKIHFPQQALKYLDKISAYSKSDPTIMEPYSLNYNYGRNYYNLKKYDEAIEYFKKNLKEKNDDASVLFAIGQAYRGKKDTDNACHYFKICSELNDKENMYSINEAIRAAVFLGCLGENK